MSEIVHPKFLEGGKIYLRPSHVGDAPAYYRWLNDREVTRWLLRQTPITLAAEEAWLARVTADDPPREHFHFAIVRTDGDRHIGAIGLHHVSWIDRTAETGWLIGEKDEWRKGYGTEAVRLVLGYTFTGLGLRKVTSATVAANVGSNRVHEKCGYRLIGTRKAQFLRDGAHHDEHLWELSAEEFAEVERRALIHATHPPLVDHEVGAWDEPPKDAVDER